MDTKNVIAAISLSTAVIVLYSLFFLPDPQTKKQNLSEKTQLRPNFLIDIVTPKTLISPYSFEYFIDENII